MNMFLCIGLGAILHAIYAHRREGRAWLEGYRHGREEAFEEICRRVDTMAATTGDVFGDIACATTDTTDPVHLCTCCREVKATHSFYGELICDSCRHAMEQASKYLESH